MEQKNGLIKANMEEKIQEKERGNNEEKETAPS
jgi:hypothetical protein